MAQGKDGRRTRVFRIGGAAGFGILLLTALFGFAVLGRSAPGIVAEQTGVGGASGGRLDVHGERLSSSAFGDRFVFALRAAAGQVSPPVLASTFPIYPGSVIERSAVYRDSARTLRGVEYRVPADAPTVLDWYGAALDAGAYRVTRDADASLEAIKGTSLVRVQTGPEPAPGNVSFGVFVSER
jgi:hypothetical protein